MVKIEYIISLYSYELVDYLRPERSVWVRQKPDHGGNRKEHSSRVSVESNKEID